jgi:hypothetical protein
MSIYRRGLMTYSSDAGHAADASAVAGWPSTAAEQSNQCISQLTAPLPADISEPSSSTHSSLK